MSQKLTTEEDSGDDLRNELMSAMKSVEETEDAEKQPTTDTPKEGAGEEGAKDPESPKAGTSEGADGEGAGEEKKPEPILKEDKAPQSWSPAAREKWSQIPDDLRKEIIRREEAAAVGVRQLNERFAPAVKFVESLGPILQEARDSGVDPTGYISSVMQTERALRTADTKGKFNVLLSLADQYGVPLREIINASVGQEVLQRGAQPGQQMTLPPELVRELEESRRWRQEQEGSRVQSEIASFSSGKEFFEDVRGQMADLLQSGVASDLNDAYDKACWADPNIRKVLIGRERQGQQRTEITERQAAAGLVNIPSQGALNVKTGNEEESLEDSIRAAFRTSSTGRI